MTSFYRRLAITLTIVFGTTVQLLVAQDRSSPTDLPKPISTAKPRDPGMLDDFGEGPIKPAPYVWEQDDPISPISQSTFLNYTSEYNDLDPNNPLERQGLPPVWSTRIELMAANAHLSANQQSENLLPTPFSTPTVPLNWNVMPKFTVGYRRPEGLGELSASYRFLITQGSGSIGGFGGAPSGGTSSSLQLHVLDLDCTLADLLPTDLLFVPRIVRVSGGVRVAGVYDQTSASGGTITNQSSSNTFVGAGPRIALEGLHPVVNNQWWLFGKFDAAGLIGSDRQHFSQTAGGPTTSAWSPASATGVPVIGVRGGLQYWPDWYNGQFKFSAGYQWEEWFGLGIDSTSYNNLMIMGPFIQGDFSF